MSRPWGPQPTGGVTLIQNRRGGTHWVIFACLTPLLGIFGIAYAVLTATKTTTTTHCADPAQWTYDNSNNCPTTTTTDHSVDAFQTFYWVVIIATILVGIIIGIRDGRRGTQFASGRYICLGLCLFCGAFLAVIGYALAYGIGALISGVSGRKTKNIKPSGPRNSVELIMTAPDPYEAVLSYAHYDPNGGGGFLGWDNTLMMRTAPPRGAMLVIGPPGASKTTAVINPSTLLAPGACVTTSPKAEVLIATHRLRAKLGRNFQFDPSTTEPAAAGVIIARWSPLVGIIDWDTAARRGNAMGQSHLDAATGNGKHFVRHAQSIVSVLLYAAHIDDADMPLVHKWATTFTSEDTQTAVYALLDERREAGDEGASIAFNIFLGYTEMDTQELAKYVSSASDILEAYKYVSVRRISRDTNFDPREFVRSRDTLHITVPQEYQEAFAPVVTALLDAITAAQNELHRNRELGREPQGPHMTWVLDEVTNIAPVPLPSLASTAGGQGHHIVAAMQSLAQAKEQWHESAHDFLSMFPTKLILPGVVDDPTLSTLSDVTGEYDRLIEGYSQSTSYVGQYHMPVTQQNPNWSIQRQRVLSKADIANPPQGYAVMFQGAQWSLIELSPFYAPFWQQVITRTLSLPTETSFGADAIRAAEYSASQHGDVVMRKEEGHQQ